MDRQIKKKIDRLLRELRSWGMDEDRYSVQELAEKFDLTVFVVRRIANAEGYDLREEADPVDPHAPTKPDPYDSQVTTRPEVHLDETDEDT